MGVDFGGGGAGSGDGGSDTPTASINLYCEVVMGDDNITTESFDIATGEILIEEVTGPITVTTWAQETQPV